MIFDEDRAKGESRKESGKGRRERRRRRETHAESRELEPERENRLERKIPREIIQHHALRERLQKVKEAEHDPVREPLDVVRVAGALDGLDGEVRGEAPAEEVRDGLREGVDGVQDEEEGDAAEEGVGFGDLRRLFEVG